MFHRTYFLFQLDLAAVVPPSGKDAKLNAGAVNLFYTPKSSSQSGAHKLVIQKHDKKTKIELFTPPVVCEVSAPPNAAW